MWIWSKQTSGPNYFVFLICLFLFMEEMLAEGDQCKRPIRPPPAHTTGMIHLARNRVNQTLLIISDYHYSFSLFLIIVIIINIISDSFKTGSIRSYWLFLPSHVLHFRKKKSLKISMNKEIFTEICSGSISECDISLTGFFLILEYWFWSQKRVA